MLISNTYGFDTICILTTLFLLLLRYSYYLLRYSCKFSLHIAAEEEYESSKSLDKSLFEELRSVENENFARLEGVLTRSFLGLQKPFLI